MSKLLIDVIPFSITPTQINESITDNKGRLIVEGVLQRAEAENQNGRAYPTEVLRREVEKYKGREIKENRAYGELDHPEAYQLVKPMHPNRSITLASHSGNFKHEDHRRDIGSIGHCLKTRIFKKFCPNFQSMSIYFLYE